MSSTSLRLELQQLPPDESLESNGDAIVGATAGTSGKPVSIPPTAGNGASPAQAGRNSCALRVRPAGLFTEKGRARLAKMICHGGDGNRRYYPHQIEGRIEAVLERIARRLEAE